MLNLLSKANVIMHEKNSNDCLNGSYHIQGVDFYQYYITVSHSDFIIINIAIASLHRLTSEVLDISNTFHNTSFPIN